MDENDKPTYIEQSVDSQPKLNIFPWPGKNLSAHAPAKPGSPLSNQNATHYNRSAMMKSFKTRGKPSKGRSNKHRAS